MSAARLGLEADLQAKVAIVGGGPVGLGLAIELGRRGVSTAVIEKERSPHHIPKGQNLTQRTMEHFKVWSVEDQVRDARLMPSGYPTGGINAYGNLTSGYAHPWFRRDEVDRYYFSRNERLPQYLTEQVLRERVADLPDVEVVHAEAVSVRQDPDGVLVGCDSASVAADFLVGCDGSRSIVREGAGISESRRDHDRLMVLLVFRSSQLHQLLEQRFGQASFFNVLHPDLDGYWRFLGRVDVGKSWFFHSPVAPDSTAETVDYPSVLYETVGDEFELEIDHIGFWNLRIAIADTYRQARIFIAGDAAHSHPPYGGYGINTGFEDARNLGWKLAGHIKGWAGSTLLDTYTQERRPVFESTARDFIENFIENDREFINKYNPALDEGRFDEAWERRRHGSNLGVEVFEPHYEGSPIVFSSGGATPSAVGTHSLEARPGHHLPPPASGDDLLGALGDDFTLICTRRNAEQADRFLDAARRMGVPLHVLALEEADMSGYGSELVLVRPDHYVSWAAGTTSSDAEGVLARSTGRSQS